MLSISLLLNSFLLRAGNDKKTEPQYFFVGTYTNNGSEGIYIYSLDSATGKLSNLGLAGKSDNPSFLALNSNGKILLAVNEVKNEQSMGYIESFNINPENHHLTVVNKVLSGGAHPCYVSVNQEGYVLAANYSGGNVALFRMDGSGRLSNFIDIQQHFGHGINTARQGEPHVHSAYFEPSSHRIFVSDLGTDSVSVYSIKDEGNGTKLGKGAIPAVKIRPGSGPRHLAFHPNMKLVYVINELSNDISVVVLNNDGSFTTIETVSTLPKGYNKPSNCADIHISNDGRFLYASNRGYNTIAVFSVDQMNGKIKLIGQEPTRGDTPRNFTLSPNEDFLLVGNQNSQNIVSFRRDSKSGMLKYVDQIKAFKPICLLFCK